MASPLKVFNGGESGGKVKLLIHTFITVPVPAAIVTSVTIAKKGSGLHSIAKIPVIAGGSGSAIDFKFKLGKTYSYKGETATPGFANTTVLQGSVALPCTPKG